MKTEDKEEELKDERFVNLATGILVVALILIFIYSINFFGGEISSKSSDWGSLGDYFNGLLSPAIGFVTIVLIFRTYKLQKKELRETQLALNAQIQQSKDTTKREMLWRSTEKVYSEIDEKYENDWQLFEAILLQINEIPTAKALSRMNKVHLPLIRELCVYLSEIDKLTDGNSMSTDYFRRRILSRYSQYAEDCQELNQALSYYLI